MGSPLFKCVDCEVQTDDINEYYMLKSPIWFEAVNTKPVVSFGVLLCIGCVEKRLGRKLNSNDFANVPLNSELFERSKRLKDRMGNFVPTINGDSGVWGWKEMAENNVEY